MGTPTQACVWSCPNFSTPAGRPFRCVSDIWLLISGDAKGVTFTVPVSVISKPSVLTPIPKTPSVALATTLLPPPSVSIISNVLVQSTTPIPTPLITTKAPSVTTIPDPLHAVIQRVSVLEKDVQELKEADNTTTLWELGSQNEKARLLMSAKASDKKQEEVVVVRNFPKVFLDDLSGLPPIQEFEFRIELIHGATPVAKSPYRLAPSEMEELSGQLKELQDKENDQLTVKNRYPLPIIDDLFDQLQGSQFFSKIDLRSGYHQLRVHEDDMPKTNCVLELVETFSISLTFKVSLELLKKEKLYAKFSKCEFWLREGISWHVINGNGIYVDPSKIEAVKNWKAPRTPTEVRSFLGLAGYYRRFIENFSKIAKSLTILTQKSKTLDWGEEQELAFQILKDKLCNVLVLALSNGPKDFVVYCDASGIGLDTGSSEELWMMPVLPKGEVRTQIIDEAYKSEYSVHPRADKMYFDLRDRYWWPGMKKDIVEYALYGRKCRSPIMWAEVGEGQLIGPELVQETTEKILQIKDRLKCRLGKLIRFRKKGKLAPKVVDRFEIIKKVGPVAYQLDLPEELNGVHDTFHVSNRKKCLVDPTLQVPLDEIRIDAKLNFVEEPMKILEREFKKLKRSRMHRQEEVHEIREALGEQCEVMDVMARDLSRFTVWAAGGISQLLDSVGATYIRYSETHVPYQRCRVRQRTDGASTFTAQQDEQQPDP
ncbi:putative reverse transcriptase domain-containing protein [Tanacetum coccineum]